ncbi:MAG: tRNA (N(6)-L-threonylcarbamoyladenosine(37)-C(2))-methylthiotransferase MtaB [Nitrospirota bacterium]|nr:tRNA (N(6)-L-threonylcarbamoyladenosine(37)-C(2))-methylthiotransferase MtaB [Nitrospirota bacterium]
MPDSLRIFAPVSPETVPPDAASAPGHPLAGRRVAIYSMGCRVNRFDAAQLRAEFLAEGALVVNGGEPFDLFVLNTCTVTHAADSEARQRIRRARRANPEAVIAVTGCYAEVAPQALAALPQVDLVVPNSAKPELVRRLAYLLAGRQDGGERAPEASSCADSAPASGPTGPMFGAGATVAPDSGGDTRLFLKVQEGCDVACAFCIIPAARGRARSMPPERVVEQVRAAHAAGYREVILAGIHLGGYGEDFDPKHDFAGLLERLLAETPMPRIRLGSLEPWGLSDHFVDLFGSAPRLMPSLHLPLQSGSASVLKRMRRPCTPEFYRRQVARILAARPEVGISTDVLTGFPGETDAEFEAGFEFVASLPFSGLHVFPYSARSGTPAAELPGAVPPQVKKTRVERLLALSDSLRAAALARQVGMVTAVLAERGGRGHTGNHFVARLGPELGAAPGEVVTVRVTGHDGEALTVTAL